MGGTDRLPPSRSAEDAAPTRPGEQTRRDADELAALRRGDQPAFMTLVRRLHPAMVRVATSYVSSREIGEEVAQDTWVAVIEELDRFEGRSSLKTWIFRILTNQAKSRGLRERRSTPFSALNVQPEASDPWTLPEERLLSAELGGVIVEAIDGLPPAQRAVVVLRDCHALPSVEVRGLLGLSESNQRVLLHRGRQRVRAAVDSYDDLDRADRAAPAV